MSKETFYFSHDYNARTDPKIKKLMAKHGATGYGLFWCIIEDLYNNENYLPAQFDTIAFDLRTDENLIKSIICDFDLFVVKGDFFGSMSVQKRLDDRSEKSKKARDSANKRWAKNTMPEISFEEQKETPTMPTQCERIENECDSNAIKESKEKESKEKNYKKTLLSEITISDFPELNEKYIEISKAFNALFRNNLIDAGASTKNVDNAKGTCVDDVRLMLESDKYTVEDLQEVYSFLQKSNFWKRNILSTSKLREKMAKLKMDIKNDTSKTYSGSGSGSNKTSKRDIGKLTAIISKHASVQ